MRRGEGGGRGIELFRAWNVVSVPKVNSPSRGKGGEIGLSNVPSCEEKRVTGGGPTGGGESLSASVRGKAEMSKTDDISSVSQPRDRKEEEEALLPSEESSCLFAYYRKRKEVEKKNRTVEEPSASWMRKEEKQLYADW